MFFSKSMKRIYSIHLLGQPKVEYLYRYSEESDIDVQVKPMRGNVAELSLPPPLELEAKDSSTLRMSLSMMT